MCRDFVDSGFLLFRRQRFEAVIDLNFDAIDRECPHYSKLQLTPVLVFLVPAFGVGPSGIL
ncbi:hypothetical protein AJ87_03000 [Rhizobium yanglingense]|nr:hypothetical protein AJ87_03000 [Rhizobium yanglingense]